MATEALSAEAVLGTLSCEQEAGNGLTSFSIEWIEQNVRPHFPELADKILALIKAEIDAVELLDDLGAQYTEDNC